MLMVDRYADVGYALGLLAWPEDHRQFQLGRCIGRAVLPASETGSFCAPDQRVDRDRIARSVRKGGV